MPPRLSRRRKDPFLAKVSCSEFPREHLTWHSV